MTEKNAEDLMRELEAERREKEAYQKACEILLAHQKKMSRRGFLKLLAAGTLVGGGYWAYKDLTKGKMSDEEIGDALKVVEKNQITTQELKEALTVIDDPKVPAEQQKAAEEKVVKEVTENPELYHDDLRQAVEEYHEASPEKREETKKKVEKEVEFHENVDKGLRRALERAKGKGKMSAAFLQQRNRGRG